jgi:hypothetical protein
MRSRELQRFDHELQARSRGAGKRAEQAEGREEVKERGYYLNSLKSWRDRLAHERRLLSRRYISMHRMKHPDTNDQGILMDINRQMIEVVEEAQRVAVALADAALADLKLSVEE